MSTAVGARTRSIGAAGRADRRATVLAWLRPAGLFVAVAIVGAVPWPGVGRGFATAFCASANVLLGATTFGRHGHARLTTRNDGDPSGGARPPSGENVSADAALRLRVDGYAGELALGVDVRREAYLPLVLLLAIALAAPAPWRARLRCVAVGVPVVWLSAVATLWALAHHTFAFELSGIYEMGPRERSFADLAFRALLLPPSTRFILAVLVAIALVARDVQLPRRRAPISG